MGLRDAMKEKPWIAWAISATCLAAAAFVLFRSQTATPPDSVQRLSQTVTIRCSETGNEWQMNRGQFEQMLLTSDGMIDPDKGIPSAFADGRLTGVLVDKKEWEETVERINAMKRAYQD